MSARAQEASGFSPGRPKEKMDIQQELAAINPFDALRVDGELVEAVKERNRRHILSTLSLPFVKKWWAAQRSVKS